MENNSGNGTVNVGCGGVLSTGTFLIFLYLKLTDVIDWSWWCVTAPLWIPTTLAFIFIAVIGIFVVIANK